MSRARLLLERGDTLTRTVLWENPDESAIDLTGYAVTVNITVGEISYDLIEGDGIVVDDDAGSIAIELTAEQTELFEEQFGKWKLYAVSVYTGVTLAEGLVFVSFYE